MNREKFFLHIRHHGLGRTVLVYVFKALRLLLNLDLMVVETSTGGPTGAAGDGTYTARQVTADEYREGVAELGETHDRPWAFARGDRCFANFDDACLVGYQFYAKASTIVRAGLAFEFPDELTYTYASYTHPDHRGRGLAKMRANARRLADQAEGKDRHVIWYVAVDNLSSRAVGKRFPITRIGYVGYVKFGKRFFCYATRGCKRAGVALRAM